MDDLVERSIDIDAPIARVWQAMSDYRQFGDWFRVAIEAPFVVGQEARGKITHPGFEHVVWRARIVAMDAPSHFAFTWHPYAVDPAVDYSGEQPTLVTFRLAPIEGGTRVTVIESGFSKIPEQRRAEALRMNSNGWSQQVGNIKAYVER